MTSDRIDQHAREAAATAPPLTPEQRRKLALLLAPALRPQQSGGDR